jgi:hypothetical protein
MNRRILIGTVLVMGLLLTTAGTALAQGPVPEGLVLWNKLGSDDEVQNSEVCPGFGISPVVDYVDGYCGSALATTNECAYLSMSPDDFFPADKTQGTVEAWIQKRMLKFIPYQDPLVGIFGHHPYGFNYCGGGGYESIAAFWSDGFTGGGGIHFQFRDSNSTWHVTNDLAWDDVPVGQWVHVAFVWDLDGIGGTSDKLRIYRDGVVVAANADDIPIPGVWPDTDAVRILGHHAYYRFGQPTAYLDNIMVWDYAITDFSHRSCEPKIEVSIDIKPGSDPNSINLKSKGVVPVAVLTTDNFDASTVDPATVLFAGAQPVRWTLEDVDGDGDEDLLFHFRTQELNLTSDSTEATLTGKTLDGVWAIEGTDAVNIVQDDDGEEDSRDERDEDDRDDDDDDGDEDDRDERDED